MWSSCSTAIPIRPIRSPARAALAALDLYRDEDLFARAKRLEPLWGRAAMGLRNLPNVLDIRTLGLTAGIDLAARPDAPGRRAYDAMVKAFHEENLVIRVTGDTLALTPPLIVGESEIADMFERVARVIKAVA